MSLTFSCDGESIVLDLDQVDRSTALKCWLAYNGISVASLAQKLDVHPSTISRAINGERESLDIIARLIEAGIPADLLERP